MRNDSQFPQLLISRLLDSVPALSVALAISSDYIGRRVQRKVRRRESHILKERLPGMLCRMLLEAADRMVANGGGQVIVVCLSDGLLVVRDAAGFEVVILASFDLVGMG